MKLERVHSGLSTMMTTTVDTLWTNSRFEAQDTAMPQLLAESQKKRNPPYDYSNPP